MDDQKIYSVAELEKEIKKLELNKDQLYDEIEFAEREKYLAKESGDIDLANEYKERISEYYQDIQNWDNMIQDLEDKIDNLLYKSIGMVRANSNSVYYHGTRKENSALLIIKDGIKPDMNNPLRSKATPIKNRIYLTPDLRTAIIYAIGGDYLGLKINSKWIERDGQFGYIFLVKGNQLTNIFPDEDNVGEILHNLLSKEILKYKGQHLGWLKELALKQLTKSQYEKVKRYDDFSDLSYAGKKLLRYMNNEQKKQLIDLGTNISQFGIIKPKEYWKFDKLKNTQLKKDISNFFELAEHHYINNNKQNILLKTGTYKLSIIKKDDIGYGEKSPLFFEDIIHTLIEQGTHHTQEDWENGDIVDRISQYYWYNLEEIEISKIDCERYISYEDNILKLMEEIKEDNMNYPPILYDPINETIIDGVHRTIALKRLGVKKVKAYIGDIEDINESPYSYKDLELNNL